MSNPYIVWKDPEQEKLFQDLTRQCSASVKKECSDMRDCHSAAQVMVDILSKDGFEARVLPCSLIISVAGAPARGYLTKPGEEAGHSVVLVNGYLCDPTFGQFSNDSVKLPDYLIIPPESDLIGMLNDNRGHEEQFGKQAVPISFIDMGDFNVAYLPHPQTEREAVA